MRKKTPLEQILIERNWRLLGKYYDTTTQAKTKNTLCYEYIHVGSDDKNYAGINWSIYLTKTRNKIHWFHLSFEWKKDIDRICDVTMYTIVGAYNEFIEEIKSICEEAKERFGIDAYPDWIKLLKFFREDGRDCTLDELRKEKEAEEEENDL